ncbi:Resolvase, helix-turn-helix region domain protein [Candidatus Magnetoovum chiemensis]|nr:Resolvase, helix-turn-helix region domain protein [Candidatus Magnetoovum chiemensis]
MIYDLINGRRAVEAGLNIDKIREIADLHIRAIATMLYGDISIGEIAKILNKSRSQIYRIINRAAASKQVR